MVVFHTTYGLLTQRSATELHEARARPCWFETQVAIGLHDDLHEVYQAGERQYLTHAGAPCDFALVCMNDGQRATELRDRIDEAYRKHSWLGVMQSRHADCLYRGEDTTPEMQQLLDVEAARRAEVLERLRIVPSQVEEAYDWMHFCDRLSLILSGNDGPSMHRRLKILTNSEGTRFDIWQDDSYLLRIASWPFVHETVELSIEYRTVQKLSYADDAELGRTLRECAVELRMIVLGDGAGDGAKHGRSLVCRSGTLPDAR